MKKIYSIFVIACFSLQSLGQTTATIYSIGSSGTKLTGYATGSGSYTEGDLSIEGYGTASTTPIEYGGYCVFDLSSIPPGSTVTSVTLGYYESSYTSGSGAPICTTYGFPGDLSKFTSSGNYVFNNLISGTALSTAAYGTSASSNQTMSLYTSFFSMYAGSKISVCLTAAGGFTRVYGIKGEGGNNTSTTTANHAPYLSIVYTAPAACSGTPTAGIASCSPGAGNSTSGLILSLAGNSTGNGLAYQWQSSSTGTGSWSSISGATNPNWTITGSSSTVYYQCVLTCASVTATSSVTQANNMPAVSCIPTYTYGYGPLYYGFFINVNPLTGDNNTSLVDITNGSTNGYFDLTDNINLGTVLLYKGQTHSLTVKSGNLNNPYQCKVYIDYNNDGTFQTTEVAGSSTGIGSSATITLSSLPTTASTGLCRMRIEGDYNAAPGSACASMNYGETRDYLVNIAPVPSVTATSSISFGSVNEFNYSSDATLTFNASSLYPSSGNLIITAPTNYYIHSGGVYYTTYNYAYTGGAVSSGSVSVVFYPTSASSLPGTLSISGGGQSAATTVSLSGTGVLPACNTVTYSAGSAVVTPVFGSSGTSITASLTGVSTVSGLTYQWYSSPDNATWTSLGSSATNTTYSSTITSNIWYYCKASCSAGSSSQNSGSASAALETCAPTISSWGTASTTLTYNGGAQTWIVPSGVTSLAVDVQGACGGFSYTSPTAIGTGFGGRVQATLAVTPGQALSVYVGGIGANGYNNTFSTGGYNGGGASPNWYPYLNGGGGGGATDIRLGGTALTNRIVVAGGGGGDGANTGDYFGGQGGGLTGGTGQCNTGGTSAKGGNTTSGTGGTGGGYSGYQTGTTGTSGTGGTNTGVCFSCTGTKSGICGGGGGGYYGGGGGGWGGGGGGSSYTNSTYASGVTHTQGYNSGAGFVIFTYPTNNTANGISAFNINNGSTSILNSTGINTAADPNSGYLNQMATSFTLTQGGIYNSSVTWATSSSYQEVQVWIDFNDNNTFETTEEVTPVAGNGIGTTTNPTAFNITIPINANPGAHQMRIRAIMEDPSNGYLTDSHLDPCTNQYLPPLGSVYNSGDVADYIVHIQGLNITAPTNDTLAFGTVNLGSYSTAQNLTLNGSYLSPTSGALTINIPDGFYAYDGTSYYSTTYTVSYSAGVINSGTTPSGTVQIAFNPAYNLPYTSSIAISGSGAPTKYLVVTGTGTSACSGTPSGGYANVSPAYGTGGSSTPFALSLTGVPTTTGLTYQWYSSTDNTTWTSLGSAATTSTYSYTSAISANTYFYCQVGCPAGGGSPTYSNSGSIMATYFSHAALCTPTVFNYNYPSGASWTGHTNIYSTPGEYVWVVPTGVTSIDVDVQGAAGGIPSTTYDRAGYGGRVTGNYPVTAGQVLYIFVGGTGTTGSLSVANGGYNGGGKGEANLTYGGGGGGGASDIRIGGASLTNRIFVAGGGGGAGMYNASGADKERGGDGGGTTTGTGAVAGENGYYNSTTVGGGGGGTSSGGAGSTSYSPAGGAGSAGTGGNGSSPNGSGGGGGGFYGGGGGSYNGGGGGSNYAGSSANNVAHTRGYNTAGNGSVKITYPNENTADGIDGLYITSATGSSLNDASGISAAANVTSGYISRNTIAPITLFTGNSYASTLIWNTPTSYQEAQVWIDFSNFGTIETSEVVSSSSAGSSGGSAIGYSTSIPSGTTAFYVNIPSTAPTGTFLMRVRAIQEDPDSTLTGPSTYLDPCALDYSSSSTPAYLGGDIADYIVNITAPVAGVTPTPTSLSFGGIVAGYISAPQYVTIDASNLTSGGSLTFTPPDGYDINVGGTRYGTNSSMCTGGSSYTYTYSGTSISGHTIKVEFTPTVSGVFGGSINITGGGLSSAIAINVSGTGNPPCTGSPAAGTTAISPTTGNAGTTFTLSNSAASSGGGITYQWQSSANHSTWTSVSGATSSSYSLSGITATTYYRLLVTCPFTSSSASNYVTATYTAPTSSCSPGLSSWISEYGNISSAVDHVAINIPGGTNFSATGIISAATTANPSTGYLDNTSTTLTLYRGGVYGTSITWGTAPANYNEVQVWIDFNDDGVFQTYEEVSAVNGYGSTSNPTTFNITIPSSAKLGTHSMRVRGIIENSGTYASSTHLDPCGVQYGTANPTYYSGDAVDYKVSIQNTSISFGGSPVACQSSSSSTAYQSYSSTVGGPDQYKITWTGTASGVFSNVSYTTLPSSPISVTVPGGLTAGTYNGTIFVKNSTSGATSPAGSISIDVNGSTSVISSSVSPAGPGLCSGTVVSLAVVTRGGSGAATYTWTGPGLGAGVTNTSSIIPYAGTTVATTSVTSGAASGQYSLAVTYSGVGCGSISPTAASSTVYTVTPQPTLTSTVTAATSVLCSGSTEVLTCNAITGGPGNPTYTWKGPGVSSVTSTTNSISAIPVSTVTASGNYSVTVSYTGGSGCAPLTGSPSSPVTVNPQATVSGSITTSSTLLCSGASETLSCAAPTGGSGTLIYTWSGPGIATITGTTRTPAAFTPTVTTGTIAAYSVSVTYSLSGCYTNVTSAAAVTVNPLPTVSLSASPSNLCSGGSETLTATPAGGAGSVVYTWSGPGVAVNTGTSPTPSVFTPTVSGLTSGAYSVSVSYSGTGCSSVSATSSAVSIDPAPSLGVIAPSLTNLCTGVPVTLSETSTPVTPSTGSNTYTWSGPTGIITTISSLTGSSYIAFTPTTTAYSGSYTLSASYAEAGCNATNISSSAITVSVQPSGTISLSYPTYICPNVVENMSASMSGGSGTPAFTWSGPGIATPFSTGSTPNYTVVPTSIGAYSVNVTYTVTGCNPVIIISGVVMPSVQSWVGDINSDWNTAANWACGTVPVSTDSVLVPAGTTYTAGLLASSTGSAGKLKIGLGANLNLALGSLLYINSDLFDTGAIAGKGKIILNGSSLQNISGNGIVNNIVLNNSSGASIRTTADTLTVTGNLTLASGNFTTNNSLMLFMSDDPITVPGNGMIDSIVSGGGSISGKVIIKQYIKGGRRAYRFWGTPFIDSIPLSQLENYIDITGMYGSAHGFTNTASNTASAFWYHTEYANSTIIGGSGDPGWKPFTWCKDSSSGGVHVSMDSNLVHRFEGFRVYMRGSKNQGLDGLAYVPNPVTVRTWGNLNTGNIGITLHKGTLTVSGAPAQDYNQVSNPYPSPVDIGAVVHAAYIAGKLYQPVVYLWNPYGGTAGVFTSYDETTYSQLIIPANTSYQVRAAYDGATLDFTEDNKAVTPTVVLLKSKPDELSLTIYDESYHLWDITRIKFTDEATDNEDRALDAGKPINPDLNFYSWSADHHPLSIDARPFDNSKVIPLGLTSNYLQNFIIKVDNYTAPQGSQIYLHDKYLGEYMLLDQGTEYKFAVTNDPASQGDNRFELGAGQVNETVALGGDKLKVLLVPNPATSGLNIIYKAPVSGNTTIRLLSLEGICVMTKDLGVQQAGNVFLSLDNTAAGIYMIEFTTGNEKVVQRLIKE